MTREGQKVFIAELCKNLAEEITAKWELYRRRPVMHGLQNSTYFDQKTFARIYPKV